MENCSPKIQLMCSPQISNVIQNGTKRKMTIIEQKNGWRNERKGIHFQWKHRGRPTEMALRWKCQPRKSALTCRIEFRLSKAVDMQLSFSTVSVCHCVWPFSYERLNSLEYGRSREIVWQVDGLNTSSPNSRVFSSRKFSVKDVDEHKLCEVFTPSIKTNTHSYIRYLRPFHFQCDIDDRTMSPKI